MEKRCEQLYISPVECAATTDTAAIQAAVDKAKQLDVNVVLIGGCAVVAAGTAFVNADADAVLENIFVEKCGNAFSRSCLDG